MVMTDYHNWLGFVGTALSGLGATVNGLNSLYGISEQVLQGQGWDLSGWTGHAVTSGLAGGAAAVTGGWLTAAKVGSAGMGASALSASTLGLGVGCLYASLGFLFLVHSMVRTNTSQPPKHAPVEGTPEAKEFPSPPWLSTRVLNWGVTGRVGAGKSTLINSMRGLKAKDPDAAPVGVGHTTRRPSPYSFVGDVALLTRNMARLWDLPGADTKDWPSASYVRDAGLRHFDGVICVTAGAFSDSEAQLVGELREFKVPYYVVRNKVDQDAVNNEQDNGASVKETVAEIRCELLENGCDPSRTFLISAKHPECADFDFAQLLRAMAADVATIRGELPEFQQEASSLLAAAARRHSPACRAAGEAPEDTSPPFLRQRPACSRPGSPSAAEGKREAAAEECQKAVPPLFRGLSR